MTLPLAQATTEAGTPTPEPAGVSTPRRILVVDDNEDTASSLGLLLRLQGHQTTTAHDGLAAIEAAADFDPEVVLLDIGLPKLNGYEACAQLRKRPNPSLRCIIALTGWGQEEDRRRAQEAGFDHHLVKPVDPELLRSLLDSFDSPNEQIPQQPQTV